MSDGGEAGWQIETSNDPAVLIDSLFPPPQSDAARRAPERPAELRALASSRRLRWIFPADARARGFMSAWQPNGTFRAWIWRRVVRASTGAVGGLLPGLTRHAIDGAAMAGLGRRFGAEAADCLPVIYVGTAGYRRKAVIGWVDKRGDCAAVGKFPLGRQAGDALRNEARALSGPAAGLGIAMPALHNFDDESGILLESSVAGRNCLDPFDARHRDLLLKFIDPEPRAAATIYADLFTAEHRRLAGLAEKLLAGHGETALRPALMHGDFITPNFKCIDGRQLALVDWEYYSPRGAPLADAIFFQYFDAYFMQELRGARLLEFVFRFVDGAHFGDLCEAVSLGAPERRRFACLGLLAVAQSRLRHDPDNSDDTAPPILDFIDAAVNENYAA
ncbi:MAG: phosphotransferase [Alphaproteobacteria bacterium]|nr:phosphotransferase [Alphaproteobacteria bacterium]MDP6589464.1 phosphotransferase [Alphaproteobacteria bacterium]MDP6816480.1 phosphotransferase [Alphaproteobacteria bacterium]